MKVLVTGGSGFIGSEVCRRLLAAGHEVSVLDDLSSGFRHNLAGLDVRFTEGSVLEADRLAEAAAGAEAVIHLAAMVSVPQSVEQPLACHEVNATGTVRVLEAARTSGAQVVLASSSAVYGSNPTLPKTEREWVRPLTPYASTKLYAEQAALAYQSSYGLPVLALRFFNVYGPRQDELHPYAAVIPTWTYRLLTGQPLRVNGDGSVTRDFIYVGTLAQVLAEAVGRRVSHPEPVNAALGTQTSLRQLVAALEAATGLTAEVSYGPPRPGDVQQSLADSSVLWSLFPDLEQVPLAEGLAQTVAWFRERLQRG